MSVINICTTLTRVIIVNQLYFLKWLLVFVYQCRCHMWYHQYTCEYIIGLC
jgi:hypothetical protein